MDYYTKCERKNIAKQNVTYDRIEKYIDYILHRLEVDEGSIEKAKNDNAEESVIRFYQYRIDSARYALGFTDKKPNLNDY